MDSFNDIELFNQAIHGDRKALSFLYLTYYDSLMHYGLRINQNKYFVEESIQELFVYITESGHRLGNVKNIKAYLFSSLRRNLLRYIELKRKEVDRLSEYTRRTDISFFSHDFQKSNHKDSESQDLLHKLLNELPWRQKEAIYLRFYNNLSTKDIAEVMNIANQTVLNMIYQALKKVKALSKV